MVLRSLRCSAASCALTALHWGATPPHAAAPTRSRPHMQPPWNAMHALAMQRSACIHPAAPHLLGHCYTQVRRKADPAKEAVREFVGRWRDDPAVVGSASHEAVKGA